MRYTIFTTLLFIVTYWQTHAQSNFLFAPKSFEEIIETEEIEEIYRLKGFMENTSDELIEVDWAIIDIDMPSEWEKSVGDKLLHYFWSVNELSLIHI